MTPATRAVDVVWAMLEELRLHTMTSAKMERVNFLNIFLNIQIPPQKLPPLCICSLDRVTGDTTTIGGEKLVKAQMGA